MKPFDCIMFGMSNYAEWKAGVSNRNYHVLRELLKSEEVSRVLFVDYLPLTFRRAVRNFRDMALTPQDAVTVRRSLTGRLMKLSDRLHVYTDAEFFIQPRRTIASLRRTARALQFESAVLWSFFPPVMSYLPNFGHSFTVFDAVDNWAEHSSYTGMKERLLQNYQDIKKSANVIFTVSEDLQALFYNQSNVYWIPNGVDLKHYQKQHKLINRDIAELPKPVVGYIGVVEDRVDIDLIQYLAKKNPTKSFAIVGPVWKQRHEESLRAIPNIHLLGYKSYEEAPAYIQQFDVAIIPHKSSKFITSTNPMKMYEYLACGKPVIATKNSGAEMFENLVYIAGTPNDFNRKLYLAIQEDNDDKQMQRKKAVESYAWSSVVQQMLDIIRKNYRY